MKIKDFEKRLRNYIVEVKQAKSEPDKAFLFLELCRRIFEDIDIGKPHVLYPKLERNIKSEKTILIRGRPDAILGNVIVEFEIDLNLQKKISESQEQLKRYTAILWNNEGIIDYLCIASDGIIFQVFRPRSTKEKDFEAEDIVLDPVTELRIDGKDTTSILKSLERYMLPKSLLAPNAEDIANNFGSDSLLYKDCFNILQKSWLKSRSQSTALYDEWAKYLTVVYGTNVENVDLFIKQTYLATLAKLMVYLYYSEDVVPSSAEEIEKIIRGGIFKKWGIENFLEEDFFTWIIRDPDKKAGQEISFKLLDVLAQYDLTKIDQDVLKELYQQLVDPDDRHDLGEFYTPDWIADMIVKDCLKNPEGRVLDPSCGSGTFLVSAIKRKLELLKNQKHKKLEKIVDSVHGIDVHPLAVLISKANYLMALGDLIKFKKKSLSLPVYMADSIIFPKPVQEISYGAKVFVYRVTKDKSFVIPTELIENGLIDTATVLIKDLSIELAKDEKKANDVNFIKNFVQNKLNLSEEASLSLVQTIKLLVELIISKSDTIYPFILRNVYKPSMLKEFDYIVGNPPWLTYHDIRSVERQREIKNLNIEKYHLLDSDKVELMSHMELATLFLVRCCDLFLKKNGIIAFVMPFSLFAADHHNNLRQGRLVNFELKKIFDFERVSPIFKLSTCVVIAKKNKKTIYPIETTKLEGKLPFKNCSLEKVEQLIKNKKMKKMNLKTELLNLGRRSAWVYEKPTIGSGKTLKDGRSHYFKSFKEGATIVPRPFWFIDLKFNIKFGFDANKPYIETSKRAQNMTKKSWEGVKIKKNVESQYLFTTILSSDMIPFSHFSFRPIVLPIFKYEKSYRLLDTKQTLSRGDDGMYSWLQKSEKYWKDRRGEKHSKMSIYERLDKNKGISGQDPSKTYVIVFSSIGTNLCSSVIDVRQSKEIFINNEKIKTSGFVADYSTIFMSFSSKNEAYYLCSIFNSKIIDVLLKPFQSKGLWGERNVWKKPLEFPIPEFNKMNKTHVMLAELGIKCNKKIQKKIPDLITKFAIDQSLITTHQTGKVRVAVRKILEKEMSEIDEHATKLLTKN